MASFEDRRDHKLGWRRKQNRFYLLPDLPVSEDGEAMPPLVGEIETDSISVCEGQSLWTLSYMPNIYGNDIPTGEPGP